MKIYCCNLNFINLNNYEMNIHLMVYIQQREMSNPHREEAQTTQTKLEK